MMAFVKFVALIGFASVANANHSCRIPGTTTSVGQCYSPIGSGCANPERSDLTAFVDLNGCSGYICCTNLEVTLCPPCETGCDPDFSDPNCITFDEYIAMPGATVPFTSGT